MLKNRIILLAITCVFVLAIHSAGAQSRPASGLYEIVSGNYIECCGIAGENRQSLPNGSQRFVSLAVDPQGNTATLTFLGDDSQTVFSVVPCPPGDPINFRFDGGVFLDRIFFHVDPGPAPYHEYWNYMVTNAIDALRIDGVVGIDPLFCVDAYTRFSHSNIVAVLMPMAAIRVSEVEVCWYAASNRTYQVQYRSALTTNAWTNLGSLLAGNGSTNCITDKVPLGQPQRFYRVLTVP
jgi:hypothetical protein